MDGPRPAEFLKINPRGLVPVLIFNDNIIIESAIICQFLADVYPSHLCPPASSLEGALGRARMSFFIDAYWSKFHVILFGLFEASSQAHAEDIALAAVSGVVAEVEALLIDANPFFGGSAKLTLAEVCFPTPFESENTTVADAVLKQCIAGPFLIRAFTLSKNGVYPTSLVKLIEQRAPNFYKWATAVCSHPSITSVFPDEDVIVKRSWAKRGRMRAAAGLTNDWVETSED